MKEVTVQQILSILDIFEVLISESAKQNDGKTHNKVIYGVKRIKDVFGKEIFKKKDFIDNFAKFLAFKNDEKVILDKLGKEVEKIQTENTKVDKDKKCKKVDTKKIEEEMNKVQDKYVLEIKELEDLNKDVISKHVEYLKEKIKIKEDLFKIKLEYLPKFENNKIIESLVDFNLISE